MSLSCQYDQVNSLNYLGDLVRQVAVEAKLKIPENYPKIAKIKGGELRVIPPTLSASEGILLINGRLNPHLVYLTEPAVVATDSENEQALVPEPMEYGISWLDEQGVAFSERIEIPGLNPEVLMEVDLCPNTVLYERENHQEVAFRGIVDLVIHTAIPQKVEVVSGIATQPVERVSVQREQLLVEELAEVAKTVIPVRQTMLLPNFKPGVSRILNYFIKPAGVSYEPYNGKIAVKGNLEVTLLYVGADEAGRPNEIFVNEWNRELDTALPFEAFIDYNAAGRVVIEPKIALQKVALEQLASREFRCQLELECACKIMNITAKELVVEVIPETGEIIDIEKHLLNLAEFVDETQGIIDFETTVNLAAEAPEIERLLTSQGVLDDVVVETGDNQLLFKGNLSMSLYYIGNSDEQRLFRAAWEKGSSNSIPISGQLSCPGAPPGATLRSRVALDELQVEPLEARCLKVRGRIKPVVVVKRPRAFNVICNCALVTPVDPATRPSMLFYVVQPEDTLWKIARKYETTVNTLIRSNQLVNPDRLETGQKILIPKEIPGRFLN
ncbi:MAG: LysM domain-containing protein [Bacillota bacterium]